MAGKTIGHPGRKADGSSYANTCPTPLEEESERGAGQGCRPWHNKTSASRHSSYLVFKDGGCTEKGRISKVHSRFTKAERCNQEGKTPHIIPI